MNDEHNDRRLDELVSNTINTEKPVFDAESFERRYPVAMAAIRSYAGEDRTGRKTTVTVRILRGPWIKLATAAVFVIAAGLLILPPSGQQEPPVYPPAETASPASIVSMGSLSTVFREGGMEALEKQFDRALDELGPRPNGALLADLLADIRG